VAKKKKSIRVIRKKKRTYLFVYVNQLEIQVKKGADGE
jgi:hypothetical protein